ncbi:DUF4112 domain-containing protein [Primorskyibacter sp. 2E107]|uniref:DUF4112 domain-containing protein n=1 Tax=Primorskyibacter sp. 2E107 TaxID=3403458 RepID=UPI003AF78BCD
MAAHPHLDRVARAESIAKRMDSALRVPFTRITFGLDSIIGLVPGVGDALAVAPSLYIVKLARDCDVPGHLQGRMLVNIGADWLIGLVPLIGDLFDVGFKANLRNAALLRAHVENALSTDAQPRPASDPSLAARTPLPA